MMKRFLHIGLALALALSIATVAAAQSTPTPVTRMGDWVEISDDVFVNFLFSSTIHIRTVHNNDYDSDVQDLNTNNSTGASSAVYAGVVDGMQAESRFGWDVRYKKNLRARMLFENQMLYDGSNIDGTGASRDDGGEAAVHVERFWIDYTFPNTPIRFRWGAWLYKHDLARLLDDDDPGFHAFYEQGPLEIQLSITIEEESGRRFSGPGGAHLQNDNDNIKYFLGLRYKAKPHTFCLCLHWERDRFGATEHDFFQVMPGWLGSIGPVKILAQGMFGFGEAENANDEDLDIKVFGFLAVAELNLGKFRPVLGVIYGSGDDDPEDGDLEGYFSHSASEINLTTFGFGFDVSEGPAHTDYISAPARAPVGGGMNGHHTVDAIFPNAIGNTAHDGFDTDLSNPGTVSVIAGVKIFPLKGHQVNVWYSYYTILETETLEKIAPNDALGNPVDYSKSLFHEFGFKWIWKINKHLTFRPRGWISIPLDGAEDIASTSDLCLPNLCDGDDIALAGELELAASF